MVPLTLPKMRVPVATCVAFRVSKVHRTWLPGRAIRSATTGYGKSRLRLLWFVLVIAGFRPAFAASDSNPAQPIPETAETRAVDELFEQLLKDPKNIDLTFRYAEAAIKAGNIEAGISSLERLLLLDRDFPGVKLELAELYGRLHSYEMAKTYLAEAEQEPGLDAKARGRLDAVRNELENATSPSKFTTNLFAGIRHQSDASAEPAGSDIVAGGVPQTLTTIFLNKPAWDAFATGNIQHAYDFGGIKLESNFLAYYSKSLGHSTLDTGAIEVNTGPRFDLDVAGLHVASTRAYVLGNDVTLGERQFLHSVGTGVTFDRNISKELSASGFYEFRSEWFSPVVLSPAANAMNANVHSFGVGVSYQVVENSTFGAQVSYALTDDFASVGSNKGLVIHLGYSQLFQLPEKLGVGPLNISPNLYRIYSKDDAPDPALAPDTIAATNEWRFGGIAKLGITNNVAANLSIVHQIATSNIPSNRTRNTQVILGAIFAY